MPDARKTRALAPDELRRLLDADAAGSLDELPTRPFERPRAARAEASHAPRQPAVHPDTVPLVRTPAQPPRRAPRRATTALQICLDPVQPRLPARHGVDEAATQRMPGPGTPNTRGPGEPQPDLEAASPRPTRPARTQVIRLDPDERDAAVRGRRRISKPFVWGVGVLLLVSFVGVGLVGLGAVSLPDTAGLPRGVQQVDTGRSTHAERASNPGKRSVDAPPARFPALESARVPSALTSVTESTQVTATHTEAAGEALAEEASPVTSGDVPARLEERLQAAVSALSRGQLVEARDLYRALEQDTHRHVFGQLAEALERQRACATGDAEVPCDW